MLRLCEKDLRGFVETTRPVFLQQERHFHLSTMRIDCTFVLLLLTGGANAFVLPRAKLADGSNRVDTALSDNEEMTAKRKRYEVLRNSYGEVSRRFRRSFFSHDDWLKHRALDRFPGTLVKLAQSGVVRQLGGQVGIIAGIAAGITLYNDLFVLGWIDLDGNMHESLVQGLPLIKLPAEPFTFSSPILSLLLVFRTNVGWKRWDEARKAWGVIVNHSRNLLRQGCSWVCEETEPDPEIRRESLEFFCNSVWSFSRSMQRHLWGFHEDDEAFQKDVRGVLDPFEAEGLIAARHKPTRANHDLSRAINELPITYLRRIEMDKSAIEFANAMGACDRIFTSPVPLFYTRHAARFLGIWLLALPLGLWGSFDNTFNHLPLIPTSAAIAFFFFGIEELSLQLEEPFTLLPLDKISGGIKLSAKEHLDWYYEHENDRAEDGPYHSRARILE